MSRLNLRFADPALEAAFVDEEYRKALQPRRKAALIGCAGMLLTWLAAGYLSRIPDVQSRTVLPMSASLLLLGLIWLFDGSAPFKRFRRLMDQLVTGGIGVFMISVVALYPPEVLAASGFVLLVVHTFNVYGILRLRIVDAAAGAWLTTLMYVAFLMATEAIATHDIARHAFWLAIANMFGMFMGYQLDLYARREFAARRSLAAERERSERLLLNILPAPIAERLKASDAAIADHSEAVTVLFADIVGFTPLSARKTPQALVQLLDRVFTEFDALAQAHGLEKIKTIGDAYMAASGLPQPRADHAPAAARMALGMLEAVARVARETGEPLAVRIGLHSGPVVAGVIGRKKFIYDLWGDTVNTASRMESHGVAGAIQCTAATAALLGDGFALTLRGAIQVDGKGEMQTFLLARSEARALERLAA